MNGSYSGSKSCKLSPFNVYFVPMCTFLILDRQPVIIENLLFYCFVIILFVPSEYIFELEQTHRALDVRIGKTDTYSRTPVLGILGEGVSGGEGYRTLPPLQKRCHWTSPGLALT